MTPGTECPEAPFLRTALAGTRFGQVTWIPETGSTNHDLAERARDGGPEQVLVTDLQTAGRGRRGRTWTAPARSSVLMSALIHVESPQDGFWTVGAMALAASETIDALTVAPCRLKWPNDVMIGEVGHEKKVAGVLAQLAESSVIVGIGINVNWPESVPTELSERGTAMNWEVDSPRGETLLDRAEIAASILRRAMRHLDADPAELHDAWRRQCSTIGQRVRLERDADAAIVGNAVDIAENGALILENAGERTTHQVGDVVHLRPH